MTVKKYLEKHWENIIDGAIGNAIYAVIIFLVGGIIYAIIKLESQMGIVLTAILVLLASMGVGEIIGVTYTYIKIKSDKGRFQKSITFIPKNGMGESPYGEYYTWLDIINNDFSLDRCTAILTKLEYEGGQGIVNCLGNVSSETTPKLRLSNSFIRKGVSEKIDIAQTIHITQLALRFENGVSKPLPDNIHVFSFEICLKGTKGKREEIEAKFSGEINYMWFTPQTEKLYITSKN